LRVRSEHQVHCRRHPLHLPARPIATLEKVLAPSRLLPLRLNAQKTGSVCNCLTI
jgi:hypothetical protein